MKNQDVSTHAEDCPCGQCQAKDAPALEGSSEQFLKMLKNTPDDIKFTLTELVSFGEYMLSDERKSGVRHQSSKKAVTDADITNWRESFYPIWIEKHIRNQN